MKGPIRWLLAQRREASYHRRVTPYTPQQKEDIAQQWRKARASRESTVSEILGLHPDSLQGLCILEIGGMNLVDHYLFEVNMRHKVLLDPLPWPRVSDDYEWIMAIGERIPIKPGSVDVCWAENSIDHCADPSVVLAEIKRILGEAGCLYISSNVFASWARPLFPILDVLDGAHPWHFTRSAFFRLLSDAGFDCQVEFPPIRHPIKGWESTATKLKLIMGRILGLRQVGFRVTQSMDMSPHRA